VAGEGARAGQMPGRPASGKGPGENVAAHGVAPSSIMAVAAHPGDAFFAMGAPVALQVHRGGAGVFLSLSLGEKGSATIAPAEYGAMQRKASEVAATALGASVEFLTYPDGEIPASDEAKLAVCDLIRRHSPALVVTHWRGSWHKDHRACYEIANDAVFYAGLPGLIRKEPAHAVQALFFAENWEDASGFTADTYLDVSTVFTRWMDACAAFPMWRGETGFRYNDYYSSLAVARGCLCGFQHAVALMSPADQLTRHVRSL